MTLLESIRWRLVNLDPADPEHVDPKDWTQLLALHVEQEAALERKMDLPNLAAKPVLIPVVAEREGVIVGAMYIEAVGECCFIGRDPLVSASGLRIAPQIFARLRARGLRILRMQIPNKRWIGAEADILGSIVKRAGFHLQDEYDHYLYDLRGGQGPAVPVNAHERANEDHKVITHG